MSGPWNDARVQDGLSRQLVARAATLAAGRERVGWKVGFGAPAALEMMEITAPLLGYLSDATVLESGVQVDISDWQTTLIEFEVSLFMGTDLAAHAGDDAARAAVAAVGPAIELANIDLPIGPESVTDIVAGNIFHRGVILGEPDRGRAGLDVAGLRAVIEVDGRPHSATEDLEALTGPYPWIVSTVATTLDSVGERLRAGDVIITGSVIPPIRVEESTEFSFTLQPFRPISTSLRL